MSTCQRIETDGRTHRQSDRQTDTQTIGRTDTQTIGQTDTQTVEQTDRQINNDLCVELVNFDTMRDTDSVRIGSNRDVRFKTHVLYVFMFLKFAE